MYYLFAFNATIVCLFLFVVSRKYGTILNPIGLVSWFYLMAAVIVPAYSYSLGLLSAYDRVLPMASVLSSVYFGAVGLTFLIQRSPFRTFFRALFELMRPIELREETNGLSRLLLFVQAGVLFVVLMSLSGAGLLWITNSREAYQHYRVGVAVWWASCQAVLMLAYVCALFRKVKSPIRIIPTVLFFSAITLFFGSKASVLGYFVIGLVYLHFRVRPIRTKAVIAAGLLLVACFMWLQIYQGTAQGVLESFLYFDYFNNSTAFLAQFHDFGFRYGQVGLSEVWFYVPRAIYPAKPFAFGDVLITDAMFPGFAEMGATPGLLPWTEGYADFGVLGVVLYALLTGFFCKGIYELFLERRDIQSLMLFGHAGAISHFQVFLNAPMPVSLVWLTCAIVVIRLVSMVTIPLPKLMLWPRCIRFRVLASSRLTWG